MQPASFFILAFLWALLPRTASSQTAASVAAPVQASPSSYYVRHGDALQVKNGDPASAKYATWEVWLYPRNVNVSGSGLGLAYTCWGVIQGSSASAVLQQLAAYQRFERAYTNFFGANSWEGFTFSYPVGPIAAGEPGQENNSNTLHSKIELLNGKLASVVAELGPSLENGDRNEASASVRQSLEQVRNSMQDVARFYYRLSRLSTEGNYLGQVLARLTPGVDQAESATANVKATLPTVRMPVRKDWMTQTESAGSDGTIHMSVAEIGSSAWVRQSWTGGDGSMSGTNTITIVPYQDIGTLDVSILHWGNQPRWTLRIQPANSGGFAQSITSPERASARRTYQAVDLKASTESLYLEFPDSRDAQDAYTFFLYHKERGL